MEMHFDVFEVLDCNLTFCLKLI